MDLNHSVLHTVAIAAAGKPLDSGVLASTLKPKFPLFCASYAVPGRST